MVMDEILAGKESVLRIHLAGRFHPRNQQFTPVSCSVELGVSYRQCEKWL